MRIIIFLFCVTITSANLSGCLAASAAGAVMGAAGDVAEGTVNVTKGAAGVVIPDGDKDK